DVTEQRRLENLREEFTNMLVHDLRSPMTVLQSSLEIMQQDLEDDYYDDLPKLVGLARQGGDRMVHLINQLLDVNKLEEGEMPVHPQELNVPKMLADIAAQLEPLARQEELQIKVVCEASLPVLFADPDLVGRALINLLDNAIKFSPDGETIELWARQDITSREPILLLGVTDRGPGIPQSAQKHLFQKFKQVIVKGARRRGTGLGLLFCRLVVEAHHGEIWVDSQEGRGSTFIMRLPARFEAAT
ncbi:MAG TPA: histidine kinase, partial [Chloroflexi bacterium]|nr:histidine kinase [Chloroflexota bacterium]